MSMVATAEAERLNAERLPAERTPSVPLSSSCLMSVGVRRGHAAPTGVFGTFSLTQAMEAASSSTRASALTTPKNLAAKSPPPSRALKSKSFAFFCRNLSISQSANDEGGVRAANQQNQHQPKLATITIFPCNNLAITEGDR